MLTAGQGQDGTEQGLSSISSHIVAYLILYFEVSRFYDLSCLISMHVVCVMCSVPCFHMLCSMLYVSYRLCIILYYV